MKREDLLKRISVNPDICFGKPCIRGHRIWVSLILDFLASGMSVPEILQQYPGLEEADILACIKGTPLNISITLDFHRLPHVQLKYLRASPFYGKKGRTWEKTNRRLQKLGILV